MPTRPLIAFANRLPIVRTKDGWRPADGGLVSALRPAMEARSGAWIGWDGGAADTPTRLSDLEIDIKPIELTRREIDAYYHGFANRSLWPLLHDLIETPIFEHRWWNAYVEANERFADVTGDLKIRGSPMFWIHDYHLMLLPAMLRERDPKAPNAFFLHTPFPAPELFARLPWARELLMGMLGADVVAFQIDLYTSNFVSACRQLLGAKVSDSDITVDGRTTRAVTRPISIDASRYAESATLPEVERELVRLRKQFSGKKVLVGVDRLDYTKGVIERLLSVEQFFETHRTASREVSFVQIAVPSRDDIKEYRDLKFQVEREVGRINGKYTEPGSAVPIHYFYRSLPFNRLLAYYRLADVALVTPLKDGMNLIAKEFVVTQASAKGSGVLLLSEFAGAAQEMKEAILCNPFDIRGMAKSIAHSLELDQYERWMRLNSLAERVRKHDVYAWVDEIITDLESVTD